MNASNLSIHFFQLLVERLTDEIMQRGGAVAIDTVHVGTLLHEALHNF